MTETTSGPKPATAARIYDFQLGGTHNFPADREAAAALVRMFPTLPAMSRAGRAWLVRAVRYMAAAGMRQFLDIGSGIPTENNVHEVVESITLDARVVYVDIDPVAVAEGLEILEGSANYTSVWGDVRNPAQILENPQVRALIDFEQPVALILSGVLHFVPDETAYPAVEKLAAALAPGSMLAIGHASLQDIESELNAGDLESGKEIYRRRTTTQVSLRTRSGIERFFGGRELVEPGLVYVPDWRPDPAQPSEFGDNPEASGGFGAIARIA